MKASKIGTAVVLGLILGLALFTTDVFAQGMSQRLGRGQTGVAVVHVLPGVTRDHPPRNLWRGRGPAAFRGPQNFRGPVGFRGPRNFQGPVAFRGPRNFQGCQGGQNCFLPQPTIRCVSQRECRTIQQCRFIHGARICQGVKICRFRSICRRCFQHDGNGWNGWGSGVGPWAARKH